MSPKSLSIAALCCILALCGCEKKTQEEAPSQPVKVVRATAPVPEGMAPIGDAGALFISTEPLTVGGYVEYLRGTGQPVPPRWSDLELDLPEAERAITGLPRQEAARCATWHLKRLPTLEEWQDAVRVVGARPYPWLEDGEAVPQGAPILLVQDWRPRTRGELEAKAAKASLAESILAERRTQFAELRDELRALVDTRREQQSARWEELKPLFFAVLDKRQAVAEAEAATEGRELALQILQRLAQEKGKLAIALKAQDLTAEAQDEAVGAYAAAVGELRNKVQQTRGELTATSAELQQQVGNLTRAVDAMGSPENDPRLTTAARLLAQHPRPPATMAEVVAANADFAEAVAELKEAPEAMGAMPSAADLRATAARLDEELAEAENADPPAEAVTAEKERLDRLGESVDREFVQEGILLNELNELIALRAAKAALESRIEGLREVLGQQ